MLQTAMASNQCNKPKKTCTKLNVGVPIFILFQWYRYYMMNGIEIMRLLVVGPSTWLLPLCRIWVIKFSPKKMSWFEFAFLDSYFMLNAKEIHKIRKGNSISNEIIVIVSDIHSVTYSPDVKTLYQCCCVS